MKSRRSLLKSALGLVAAAGSAASSSQAAVTASSVTIQPIGITSIVGLLPSTPVWRGSAIRFYAQVSVNGKPAPAGIFVGIQVRFDSSIVAPCTLALCPTDCAGWVYYDYIVPVNTALKTIYLSAYFGGRSGACALTPADSNKTLVPIVTYGVKPV